VRVAGEAETIYWSTNTIEYIGLPILLILLLVLEYHVPILLLLLEYQYYCYYWSSYHVPILLLLLEYQPILLLLLEQAEDSFDHLIINGIQHIRFRNRFVQLIHESPGKAIKEGSRVDKFSKLRRLRELC
jgi:hypothetical protein